MPEIGTGTLCCLCKQWKANNFDGFQWHDSEALCLKHNCTTPRGHRCEQGEPFTPETIGIKNAFAQSALDKCVKDATVSFEDEMETWYKQNQWLFESKMTEAEEGVLYTKQLGDLDIDWEEERRRFHPLNSSVIAPAHLWEKEEQDYEKWKRVVQICLQPSSKGDRLFLHQQQDFWRFKDATEIAEFAEQGCGKSAILLRIAAYKFLLGHIDSLLLVSPNDVHRQWAIEQIPLWLPPEVPRELQLFGGRGGASDTFPFRYPEALHVVSTNIDTFSQPTKWKDIAEWAVASRTFIVLDEATCIKSINAKRTERMLYEFNDVVRHRTKIVSSKVRTVARAILTGTPTTNGVTDLWTLMEFLRPNYFGRNWYSFRQRYAMLASITTPTGAVQIMVTPELWQGIKDCDSYDKAYMLFGVTADTYDTIQKQEHYQGAYKHEEELKELIQPVSSFRLLKDCVDMPPQVYHKRTVTMSPEQKKAYHDMEQQLLAMYGGATTTAANKLAALIRLQQISSGFIVQGEWSFDPNDFELRGDDFYDLDPGQVVWLGGTIPKLEALYRDVDESARPLIIITRFSAEAARIYDDLCKQYSCLLYTGWKKTGTIEDFKEGKFEILVANIRCISRGFNLQNAYQMLFYSNTFSLEDRLQTEGRIFRIGQKNPCAYTDYINEGTVDLKTVGALRQKRKLLDYIRGCSLSAFIEEENEVTQIEEMAA